MFLSLLVFLFLGFRLGLVDSARVIDVTDQLGAKDAIGSAWLLVQLVSRTVNPNRDAIIVVLLRNAQEYAVCSQSTASVCALGRDLRKHVVLIVKVRGPLLGRSPRP